MLTLWEKLERKGFMKRICTLILAAGLVFGAATGASAVDFKARGQWLMPGRALGRTTRAMVCDFVAPSASEASRYVSGTLRSDSSAVPMMTGSVSTARVSTPESMLTPNPQNVTKNESPNKPKTTDGTPARLLTPNLTKLAKALRLAYSLR